MHTDDGLGQAMSLSYAEKQGKDAMAYAKKLELRINELEDKLIVLHRALAFGKLDKLEVPQYINR